MSKKSPAPTKTPKSPQAVPDWAKKVKAYREDAGITQGDIQKAFKAPYNFMSPLENGRRKFTPMERKLFFELIGKDEDTSIPTSDRDTVPSAPKQAHKAVKAAKKPAKTAKTAKAAKAPKAKVALLTTPAPVSEKSAAVSVPEGDLKDLAAPVAKPKIHGRRGRKPSIPAAFPVVPAPEEKALKAPAPKQARKRKSAEAVSTKAIAATATPIKTAAPASAPVISPVKEAVLSDISRILCNSGLSDSQAKALHNLFTSLAVNALLSA
jgi:hypothetical protein